MDLSRYQNIVLHFGGQDIDANTSQTSLRAKYLALLNYLEQENCKIFVSGLLPRRGFNIKPLNNILGDLCKSVHAEFIDSHDSFVMSSGEPPFDFFFQAKGNLKL